MIRNSRTPRSAAASNLQHRVTMGRFRTAALLASLALLPCAARAQNSGLAAVLARMDASSKNFRSTEASVKREQYDRLVHDTTTQIGTMYFQRTGAAVQMGAKFDPPSAQIVEYKNGTVRLYSAGTNHLDTYSAARNQAQMDTFVTLGFGGSGADLAKAWTITDQGADTIDGVKVEKLDLVSKDPAARSNFTHITIWIDPDRDVSLKQEFFDPAGNTNTATYSNIRYNQPIKDLGSYAIKCKGACN